jgi:DNA-binding transcriptional regulator GbsR (MarR family)
MSPTDDPITRRFIEEAGNATQALGVGRVAGQIFAYLYFSEQPRSLDDMKEALGISKGGASMCVRQLEQWGAVQRVWVKGDRKDFYTANDYFGRMLRNVIMDVMGKRITSLSQLLDDTDAHLDAQSQSEPGTGKATNHAFLRGRVKRLRDFQGKVQSLWGNPLVKMLMK